MPPISSPQFIERALAVLLFFAAAIEQLFLPIQTILRSGNLLLQILRHYKQFGCRFFKFFGSILSLSGGCIDFARTALDFFHGRARGGCLYAKFGQSRLFGRGCGGERLGIFGTRVKLTAQFFHMTGQSQKIGVELFIFRVFQANGFRFFIDLPLHIFIRKPRLIEFFFNAAHRIAVMLDRALQYAGLPLRSGGFRLVVGGQRAKLVHRNRKRIGFGEGRFRLAGKRFHPRGSGIKFCLRGIDFMFLFAQCGAAFFQRG